ncbi:MAG: enolase C-terminal domain-like protein [Patescibacteria group bacterium]|nr:phosphopyruvate hydratase [Patescibacteria group bacterium]
MPIIKNISSRKILNSKSEWTIETTLVLDEVTASASVPGGTSVGSFEAKVLPVPLALQKIKDIKPKLVGREFYMQEKLDKFLLEMDGTAEKSNLGANTILSVSHSFARACSLAKKIPLHKYIADCYGDVGESVRPKIMMLIFEGGKHGAGDISIQEFMIVVDSVEEGDNVYDMARKTLLSKNLEVEVGLEGAFSPVGFSNENIFDLLTSLSKFPLALDVAATSAQNQLNFGQVIEKYNVLSIEDPFGENEWDKWIAFTKSYGNDVLIVGDDLVVTSPARIQKAIDTKACNGIIIKPNQIGTLTETLQAVKLAKDNGLKVVVSHRSGETNDSFIADLAVGVNADFVKFGSPSRGERVAKYNRLLEIF